MNKRGKAYSYVTALLVAALLTALVVSSAAGTSRHTAGRANFPRQGALTLAEESLALGTSLLGLTLLTLRIRVLISEYKALAQAVRSKLSELSRVVQGAKCKAYLASVLQLSDAGPPVLSGAADNIPEDPRGVWMYANGLSDRFTPLFCGLLARSRALRTWLGLARPAAGARGYVTLMLGSCDLQAGAARRYLRALELVRDCDECTVGQACELASQADVKLADACDMFDRAERAIEDLVIGTKEVAR